MSFINTTYRFYLSFENTFCTDYITEKAFNVYNDLNVIPVVRGGANYSKLLPSGTYIDASDFPSPEALGDYLVALGYDRVVYAAMLEKKHRYRALTWSWKWPLHWCQLCQLVNRAHTFLPGSRIYPDIAHWITHRACWPPRDLP